MQILVSWRALALGVVVVALAAPGAVASTAAARIFGTNPVQISVGPRGEQSNGAAFDPSISGDNRRASYVAFASTASNLVAGDDNGVADVFLYRRPGGTRGTNGLDNGPARPAGRLVRVSLGRGGADANGPSSAPALDGSIQHPTHCVAFASAASNLAPDDTDSTSDVFVRDLAARRTYLVSRGIDAAAIRPTIGGDCGNVTFQAGGEVYVADARGGRPRSLGPGGTPDISLDGSAIVWQRGDAVLLRRAGRTSEVAARGWNAHVSDGGASRRWTVVFDTSDRLAAADDNGAIDVYIRSFGARGGGGDAELMSASHRGTRSLGGNSANGGLTAYARPQGMVILANAQRGATTIYVHNEHTGNIDDLAHVASVDAMATSARANFVAFAAGGQVFLKHLTHGEPLAGASRRRR